MSALAQAALISGSIFLVVMLSTYGRRVYNARHMLIRPLILTGVVGWIYLPDMPHHNPAELLAYAVAVVLGLAFGGAATMATRIERSDDGRIYSVTGPAFMAIWAGAMLSRLAFIWTVENIDWAREHFGRFMVEHQISLDAIAPFFVIWALTMVLSRLAVVSTRAANLRADAPRERALV